MGYGSVNLPIWKLMGLGLEVRPCHGKGGRADIKASSAGYLSRSASTGIAPAEMATRGQVRTQIKPGEVRKSLERAGESAV